MYSLTFVLCLVLVHQYHYFCFGQKQEGQASGEGSKELSSEGPLELSTEVPSDISILDTLNDTDILSGDNGSNETDLDVNNATGIDYDDGEGNGSLTTTVSPDATIPSLPEHPDGSDTERELSVEDFCTCNLKIDMCDVNCCCDEDCDEEDKQVFSHCQKRPQPQLDSNYCFQEQYIIFSNRTEYAIEYTHPGAFCIITDNLPQRTTYTLVKGATNEREYEALERKRRRNYSWLAEEEKHPVTVDPYKDGTLVWGVDDAGAIFPLGIPVSIIGSDCEAVSHILYLQDAESSCHQRLYDDIALECQSNGDFNALHFLDFLIISDPRFLHQSKDLETTTEPGEPITTTTLKDLDPESIISNNSSVDTKTQEDSSKSNSEEGIGNPLESNAQDDSRRRRLISYGDSPELLNSLREWNEDVLLTFQIFLCQMDIETCVERKISDVPQPLYDNGVCADVLSSIEYLIVHNGSEGITNIQAIVHLTNLSDAMIHVNQKFSIRYLWSMTEEKEIFKRSGRPGYIKGKPLLMGRLVQNLTEEDVLKEAIRMDINPKHWLKILSAGSDGLCTSQSQVTFGVDMRGSCMLQVTQQDFTQECELLQRKILQLLLGPIPLNDEKLRVASFGDSSVNNRADWVPILVPEEPRCGMSGEKYGITRQYNLVTSLQIEVAYSLQGSLANPQPKVVGVVLRFGDPRDILYPYPNALMHNLELVSSVSFIDVTKPPLPAYSQPPVLDIKLPYDFFYPFLPSSASYLPIQCIILCFFSNIVWQLLII